MADEKATVEQTAPETTPETPQAGTPEKAPEKAADAGAQPSLEDRFKALEEENKGLQQERSARDAQHRVETERFQRESAAETERRVTQAVQTTEGKQATALREAKIADARRRADQGEEGALEELTALAREPHQQAQQSEEAEKVRTEAETKGWLQGYTTSLNSRLEKTKPSDERRAGLIKLYDTGKFQELEDEMAKDEAAGGTEKLAALEKRIADMEGTNTEASTEEAAQAARAGGGADLGGGAPAGGSGDDAKRLLDPTTPVSEIMEIRARQKAAGE